MEQIVSQLLAADRIKAGDKVLDVGSYDVNGTYKSIFEKRGLLYTGTDREKGPNVDIVMDACQLIGPDGKEVRDEYDMVVSGQMLEHMEFPLLATIAMKRAVKPAGYVIWIVPYACPDHKHPIDCWRIMEDGMEFLLEGFDDVHIFQKEHKPGGWAGYTVGVGIMNGGR